jgi:hypothetical protein
MSREYRPVDPPRYTKNADGSFTQVMEPIASDADWLLSIKVSATCCGGTEGHPAARFVGSCRIECPDCGAYYFQRLPIDVSAHGL